MEGDDDDEDPGAKVIMCFKSYKFYWDDDDDRWRAQRPDTEPGMYHTWPPPADYLYEDDDDDPDAGCEVCQGEGSYFSPGRAYNAFYDGGYSLRDSWCAGNRCNRIDMSDAEDEYEEEPSPAVDLLPAKDGSPHCQTKPFLSTQKVPASAEEEAGIQQVDGMEVAVQHFWRPWEDEQENKSDTASDILAGQRSTAAQTLLCSPPCRLNGRGWKRRRTQRDLVRRRERQISHICHSTPSKPDPFGNTWRSGVTGGCEGGLGNSGDGPRLDWSSTSTRGGLEGVSDATRTHTGWVAGRLHWSSSNAGTRGVWGGDHDWSSTSTRGGLKGVSDATRTPAPTGGVAERLDWSSSNAGTRGMWGGDYDWSSTSTRGGLEGVSDQTRTPAPTGGLDWSSNNAGTRGPGAWLGMGGMGCGNLPCSPQGQWNWGASGIINSPSLPPFPWPNVVCGSSCYPQAYCSSCQQWGNIVPIIPG